MKSANGWNHGGDGNNSSGFTGLPGGLRDLSGAFYAIGSNGYWWSSTQSSSSSSSNAWSRFLFYFNAFSYRTNDTKTYGFSVRCVRD